VPVRAELDEDLLVAEEVRGPHHLFARVLPEPDVVEPPARAGRVEDVRRVVVVVGDGEPRADLELAPARVDPLVVLGVIR
jgi:hypothetical protein